MAQREWWTNRVTLPAPVACKASVQPSAWPMGIGASSWLRSTLSAFSARRFHQISLRGMARMPGIEPGPRVWHTRARPSCYIREGGGRGDDSNARTPKGPDLQSGCFGLLHTHPKLVAGRGIAPRSPAYETGAVLDARDRRTGAAPFFAGTAERRDTLSPSAHAAWQPALALHLARPAGANRQSQFSPGTKFSRGAKRH